MNEEFTPAQLLNKSSAGFTLIETVLVVSIISLISSIVLYNVTLARAKARDLKRVLDIKQIATALDIYNTHTGIYPISQAGGANERPSPERTDIPELVPEYIASFPTPPSVDNNICDERLNQYKYRSIDGRTFSLTFCIGTQVGSLPPGYHIITDERRTLRYDITNDGVVNGADVSYLVTALSPDCSPKMEVCDVNFGGTNTTADAQCLVDILQAYPIYPNSPACTTN